MIRAKTRAHGQDDEEGPEAQGAVPKESTGSNQLQVDDNVDPVCVTQEDRVSTVLCPSNAAGMLVNCVG